MNEEHDSIASVSSSENLGFGSSSAEANPMPPRAARQAPASSAANRDSRGPAAPDPVEQSAARINARLAADNRALVLRVNPQTGLTIAEITNASTGQVLQQIPSRDLLHLAELLQSWADGHSTLIDMIA